MGTSNEHGQLFDRFPAMPNPPHGGSLYDEDFDLQRLEDDHGERFDRFAKPKAPGLHGERFDDFGWRDMPQAHGFTFDTDFNQPTAHDGSDRHATWFDAFRGGAQVRYRNEGADYEGTVIDLNRDYAVVERPDGQRQEIGIQQVLQWREASRAATLGDDKRKPTAHPGETDTSVVGGPQGERPSGESHEAMGGGERKAVDPDAPFASTALNKTAEDADGDVEKSLLSPGVQPTHACTGPDCGMKFVHVPGSGFHAQLHGSRFGAHESPSHNCPRCTRNLMGNLRTLGGGVGKTVDSTETAVEREDVEGKPQQAGKAWCSKCKHFCTKAANGKCPTCGGKVSVRKTAEELDDVAKQLREDAEAAFA